MTGASSDGRALGVAALLKAVHEMDAVVDADADERHDGEDREQIELDAGDRQRAGGPDQPERRRQQRVDRQPPVAERHHHQRDDDQRADRRAPSGTAAESRAPARG